MPLQLSRFFIGREAFLWCLHEKLKNGSAVALTGLSGIGKTQTALAYAYNHRQDYSAVLWVQAATRNELVAGFVTLATVLGLPEQDVQKQMQIVEAVKCRLEQFPNWLLILDNANDLSLVREFIPVHHSGRLLLTTLAQATGEMAEDIELDYFPPDIGALFLLRRAKRLALGAPLDAAVPDDQAAATAITWKLGGLPLALDQAGAYLEEMRLAPCEYLPLYQQAGQSLRAQRGELAADHPSVKVTFSLAFSQVAATSPAAAELLRLCAFLHPNGIPEEILIEGAAELGPVLGHVLGQPLGLIELRREVSRFSLLHRDVASRTLLIHPVVQAVLRDDMETTTEMNLATIAVNLLVSTFPVESQRVHAWDRCTQLLPHALAVADHAEKLKVNLDKVGYLLNKIGVYLYKRAQYNQAELIIERALKIHKEIFGCNNLKTAIDFKDLSNIYHACGRYKEAESLIEKALMICENAIGCDNSRTVLVDFFNDLAGLYQDQGRYNEALSFYQRALKIEKSISIPDKEKIITTLNRLASLLCIQGCYSQAEHYYKHALEVQDSILHDGTLEPDPNDRATTLNGLASVYKDQKRYTQAEPLYQSALALWEQILGKDHPYVANALNNLAMLYLEERHYAKARGIYQRVRIIYEEVLKITNHCDFAMLLNNIAETYRGDGSFDKAEQLYRQALKIWENIMGMDNPQVAFVFNNLAVLLQSKKDYVEAESLYCRAQEIWEKNLKNDNHPLLANLFYNLAILYSTENRYSDAEIFYQRALTAWEKTLGPDHHEIAKVFHGLSLLYKKQARYPEATLFCRRALDVLQKGDLEPAYYELSRTIKNDCKNILHRGGIWDRLIWRINNFKAKLFLV